MDYPSPWHEFFYGVRMDPGICPIASGIRTYHLSSPARLYRIVLDPNPASSWASGYELVCRAGCSHGRSAHDWTVYNALVFLRLRCLEVRISGDRDLNTQKVNMKCYNYR